MESKKTILKVFLFSVIFLLVGLITLYPDRFGICNPDDRECVYSLAFTIGEPLSFFMILFIPSVLLVFAFRDLIYQTWKKFALVYIPLAAILVALVPVYCGGNFISFFCLNKENTSWLTAGGFLVITLIFIITKKLKSKSSQNL